MTTRADICAEALTWLGTPYVHEACVKQGGVDCAMLLVGIGEALGLIPLGWRPGHYSPEWHLHQTEPRLEWTLQSMGGQLLAQDAAHPGDIALMLFGRVESHAGIVMPDNQIIHATLEHKRVVLHTFAGDWLARWTRTYAYPGVVA